MQRKTRKARRGRPSGEHAQGSERHQIPKGPREFALEADARQVPESASIRGSAERSQCMVNNETTIDVTWARRRVVWAVPCGRTSKVHKIRRATVRAQINQKGEVPYRRREDSIETLPTQVADGRTAER